MKKLILILFLICLVCGGCSNAAKMHDTYPHITLESSAFYADNVYIPVQQEYTFNPKNYYNEVETEQGYDIIIHLIGK